LSRRKGKKKPVEQAPEKQAPAKQAPRILPHLIGAFVLFHVVASCLSVLPDVGNALDRSSWRDPRIQREMTAWSGRLSTPQPELEDRLYSIAVSYHETRAALLTPFDPYLRAAGLRQSWSMFAAGTEESNRFGVHVHRCAPACQWTLIYLHGDDERAWRRSVLGHPRVRSAIFRWSWPSYHARYSRGCRAIAALALADFPDADAVRCTFERSTTHSPSLTAPPPPEWGRAIVIRR
jgi:hypothetical protein